MSNSPQTQPPSKSNTQSSSSDAIDLTDSPAVEMDDLIKETLSTISQLVFLSQEIENDRTQLQTFQTKYQGTQFINKIRVFQDALADKIQCYEKQQASAVQGVTQMAEKYQHSFSLGLGQVRERIEESMVRFGSILSKDALNQINKNSNELAEEMAKITDEQGKRITSSINDMETKLRLYDEKYKALTDTVTRYSKTIDQLNATNLRSSQAIAANSIKISTFQQNQEARNTKIEKEMATLKDRIIVHTKALESLSENLKTSIKKDMGMVTDKLYKLAENQRDDRRSLEKLKSSYASIKQQLADVIKQKTPAVESSTDYNTLKSTVDEQEQKVKELHQKVNSIVRKNEAALETNTINNKMVSSRIEDMEKNMTQVVDKLQAVQKQMDHAKNNSTVVSGEKRPLESIDDTYEAMIKRMDDKLTSLAEYIYQFQSTLLEPEFPARLESTVLNFEACLKNHELFLAYLVDPIAAVKLIKDNKLVDDLSREQASTLVTPAMLSTISQFIIDEITQHQQNQKPVKRRKSVDDRPDKLVMESMKKYVDEVATNQVEPLKRKIQYLEQQLMDKVAQK